MEILSYYPFPSSLALKLQTKILFLIFPAVVRVLFGQRSPARAANGHFLLLSAPRTAPQPHSQIRATCHPSLNYESALGHHLTLVAVYDMALFFFFFPLFFKYIKHRCEHSSKLRLPLPRADRPLLRVRGRTLSEYADMPK